MIQQYLQQCVGGSSLRPFQPIEHAMRAGLPVGAIAGVEDLSVKSAGMDIVLYRQRNRRLLRQTAHVCNSCLMFSPGAPIVLPTGTP